MAQNTLITRTMLRNRYVFEGKLVMQTALHIGGGKETLSHSDSPVVLTPEELPFIPGSSFKGALRSITEKLVASFESPILHTCGLPTEDVLDYKETCPTAHQEQFRKARHKITEEERQQLCHTCQLFGSPFVAARITLNDLYLINDEWSGTVQIRDGVAIDRDSETAKKGLKYDFEVVPATTAFALRLVIENATEQDLQLISIGLSEFSNGFGGVGGLRSRGLGSCLLQDLTINYMDLSESNSEHMQHLQQYLLHKKLTPLDTQSFFKTHLEALFKDLATDTARQ